MSLSYNLPQNLSQAIEEEVSKIDFSIFSKASSELSLSYRNNDKLFITSNEQRLAYIGVRLPATYSVIVAVFLELSQCMPELTLESLLDLGAGPGTVMWAVNNIFEINQITLIEQDKEMIVLGKRLVEKGENPLLSKANWLNLNLMTQSELPIHDCLIASYALGEMDLASQKKLLLQMWQATKKVMILIEPGTVKGFKNILAARNELIKLGANLIAPCPHKNSCPIAENDWCHFSQRVERSSYHRRAKKGLLSYEDEKFSYLIVSKDLLTQTHPRIIRHPLKRPGHIGLELCTSKGIEKTIVSQKNKAAFKLARKASWGEIWINPSRENQT
jgi:ribosomal protein RSM22 (predicted rRNA methylase)